MARPRPIDIIAALGLATVGIGTFAAVLPAQTLPAEARASRACTNHGLVPQSVAFEQCLSRVGRAMEWGEPEIGYTLARISSDAKNVCINSGVKPASSGFQSCLDHEIEARSLLVFTDDQSHPRDWPPARMASQ